MNDFQRKQIEQYRQLLKQSGKYLPQEIDDMVNEKIREIEHISKLLGGRK